MSSSRYAYLDVDEIVTETDLAFLFRVGDEDIWVPKSQIADKDDYEVGDKEVEIGITKWWCEKNGFEVDDES